MTNKYLIELREHHYNRKTKYSLHPSAGDEVLDNDILKRCDWKIGKTAELIISNDKSLRAAKTDVISNDRIITLKRPVNKFPVEFSNQYTI